MEPSGTPGKAPGNQTGRTRAPGPEDKDHHVRGSQEQPDI